VLFIAIFSLSPILKARMTLGMPYPKSQVPDKSPMIRLVANFPETVSVGDRKRSGRPTLLSDVSV
jgi:hypothetical protein